EWVYVPVLYAPSFSWTVTFSPVCTPAVAWVSVSLHEPESPLDVDVTGSRSLMTRPAVSPSTPSTPSFSSVTVWTRRGSWLTNVHDMVAPDSPVNDTSLPLCRILTFLPSTWHVTSSRV